ALRFASRGHCRRRRLARHRRAAGDVDWHFAVHRLPRRVSAHRSRGRTMTDGRRLLIVGGIALALWGMGYGLWYAVFAEHQALDNIGASLATGFSAAAERNNTAADAALLQYRAAKYNYDRQVDVHGHWIGLAMLLIVVGIAYDRVAFSSNLKFAAALGL